MTVLVARELAGFDIDFAVLSETRHIGEEQFTEPGSGYTLFWKGKAERHVHSTGSAIKNKTVLQILEYLVGLNEHLMTLHLQLTVNMQQYICPKP